MTTLLHQLQHHAHTRPDALAYAHPCGPALTYSALATSTTTLAHQLHKTLPPNSVILLVSPNQLAFPIAFLAALAAGHTIFPLSTELTEPELKRAAKESNATALIGDDKAIAALQSTLRFTLSTNEIAHSCTPSPGTPGEGRGEGDFERNKAFEIRNHPHPNPLAGSRRFRSLLPEYGERGPGAAFPNSTTPGNLLLQSSGTTAVPKIVRRPAPALDAAARIMSESIGMQPTDRILMTVPLSHSYGLEHGLLAPLYAGAAVILAKGLDLSVLPDQFQHNHITLFPAVPSAFEILANNPDPNLEMPTLRIAYSAGGPLPLSVYHAFKNRFGHRISQLYGATEVGSVTFNAPSDDFDPTSVGPPMRDVSLRILNPDNPAEILPPNQEGILAVRSASMFTGYLTGDAELIDNHFITGDLAKIDTQGRLFITGRIKSLIDIGGMKVNPAEVEAILAQHPAVAHAAVVAVKQTQTIHRLKAILVPRDPTTPIPVEELRTLARQNLAAYKIPRTYEVRASLPLSPTGKLLRHLLEQT